MRNYNRLDLYETGDIRRRIANLLARFDVLLLEELEELAHLCITDLHSVKEVLTAIEGRNEELSFRSQDNFINRIDYRKAKLATARPAAEDPLDDDAYKARVVSARGLVFGKKVE